MAIKARVQLRGCLSHTARGRRADKGKPFITTNPGDIAYYKHQSVYSVSMLEDSQPPPIEIIQVPVEKDTYVEPILELVTGEHTKSELMSLKKVALAQIAYSEFNLIVDPDKLNKAQMVSEILKAQIDALTVDDED